MNDMRIRVAFIFYILSFILSPAGAQTAKQVLDKTAAIVSAKQGAQAKFTMSGNGVNTTGTLAIKGRKFHATTPQAIVWFDGKTQWTYMKKNDEVNVSTPTNDQLQSVNPYHFIYMYKQGYTSTLAKKGPNYEVHLKATDKKKSISEMYITVNQKNSIPSQLRIKQQKGWTTIDVRDFKTTALTDGIFRFNSKDFPSAEVIDLR